jgi:hypothetical protein
MVVVWMVFGVDVFLQEPEDSCGELRLNLKPGPGFEPGRHHFTEDNFAAPITW